LPRRTARTSLVEVERIAKTAGQNADPIVDSLRNASESAERAAKTIESTADTASRNVEPIVQSLRNAASSAEAAAKRAEQLMGTSQRQNYDVAELEEMVIHTLAFDLANRLPEGMMILPGQAQPSGAMRSVSVTFEDLAPGPDRVFVLDARWTLTAPGADELTRHERITVPLESTESPAIVAAMSRALATLAGRIVAAIQETAR
jgi:hypothetical protein